MKQAFVIPAFKLPVLLGSLGQRLPGWPMSCVLGSTLSLLAKTGMLSADQLAGLEGRRFAIHVRDLGCVMQLCYAGGLFRPVIGSQSVPEVTLAADLSAFLRIASRQVDPDTLFFGRELTIEGDTDLGLILKNMFDAVDWNFLQRVRP